MGSCVSSDERINGNQSSGLDDYFFITELKEEHSKGLSVKQLWMKELKSGV